MKKKCTHFMLLSLIILIGFAGSASALSYSVSLDSSLTLMFGDPVFENQQLDQLLSRLNNEFDQIATFSKGDILDFTIEFIANDLQVAILPDDLTDFNDVQWQQQISLIFNFGDVLAMKTPDEIWTLKIIEDAPEASTFILLGLGLIALFGLKRWKRQG